MDTKVHSASSRRDLLKGGAAVGAAAWAAPQILSAQAAAAATPPVDCPCGVAQGAVQLLTQFGQGWGAEPCVDLVQASVTLCRTSITQTMLLARDAAGTLPAYFDDVGIVTVTRPSTTVAGLNVEYFRQGLGCGNPAYPTEDLTALDGSGYNWFNLPPGPAIDITTLFGEECGDFTVAIVVRDNAGAHSWTDTYVVPV